MVWKMMWASWNLGEQYIEIPAHHICFSPFPVIPLLPCILICASGISSQISHLYPSLVWDSALGKRQTKIVSSTMRPSFSTGCATASGEWWCGVMMEGTDFSQMSHLTLSKPKRDLPQPMIRASKKVGLCLEQGTYAGLGLVTWNLIVENLYCQVNELLLYSSPLLLDKAFFHPIVCFWDSERSGVWSKPRSKPFIALPYSWYQRGSGITSAKTEESMLSSFLAKNWRFFKKNLECL